MIEVKEQLYVRSDEFFKLLCNSLIQEINNDCGKKVRFKDLKKGFTYKKVMKNKLGQSATVKVKFTDFKLNEVYAAEFDNGSSKTLISYRIEELDDDSIGVTYHEEFNSDSTLKNLNQKFMEFLLYRRKAKKRATNLLRSMEKYILEDRVIDEELEKEREE